MNALERFCREQGWDEKEAMNRLQEHGIVSDLAVTAADVAAVDCERAVAWLKEQRAGGLKS